MKKLFIFVLIFSIFLSLVACSFNLPQETTTPPEEIIWDVLDLGPLLPAPSTLKGYIYHDYDDWLNVEICNATHSEYKKYISACVEMGYTIDSEKYESRYEAFNEEGYKLSLFHNSVDNSFDISLRAPERLSEIQWPTDGVGARIPEPSSLLGKIKMDSNDSFTAIIGNTSIEEYKSYVAVCAATGFDVDQTMDEKTYSASHIEGYLLTVSYVGCDRIEISIKLATNIAVPSSATDYKGEHYESVVTSLNNAGFTNIRTEAIYDIILGLFTSDGDVESVSIDGNNSFQKGNEFNKNAEIVITYHTWEDNDPSKDADKVTITMNASDFIGMEESKAEEILKNMGFSNIKKEYVSTTDPTKNDKIIRIEITEFIFGNTDFSKGDKFDKDSSILLKYYQYTEPTKPRPVYYSTNDYATARLGNTGVFSYVKKGGSYDNYWIIDFDAGYVYWFTEGNGEKTCDKVRIVSGTLNDRITITYQDSGDTWSYLLFFKYKNQPETLIMVDNNGFDWVYEPTDLEKALKIKASKAERDYSANPGSTDRKKITVPKSNLECEGLSYGEVVKLFENAGFTNISTKEVWSEDAEAESVAKVSVKDNTVFESGAEYWSDAPVVIYYYVPIVTQIVYFYTTNDPEMAKLGNTGVYAYVMKHKTYNVYWVIDFDEGYVYTFTDQPEDDYCSRIKIKSGTLNDRVTITYYADNMTWSQCLYFKAKKQPLILIMQDEDGYTYELETTNLIAAWEIMDSKIMVNY